MNNVIFIDHGLTTAQDNKEILLNTAWQVRVKNYEFGNFAKT